MPSRYPSPLEILHALEISLTPRDIPCPRDIPHPARYSMPSRYPSPREILHALEISLTPRDIACPRDIPHPARYSMPSRYPSPREIFNALEIPPSRYLSPLLVLGFTISCFTNVASIKFLPMFLAEFSSPRSHICSQRTRQQKKIPG